MALQRLLGTMLASRLAGKGGMGGGLGSVAMMGMGGSMLRSKAGLAALGYLAYRSYKNSNTGSAQAGQGAHHPGGAGQAGSAPAGGSLGGALGGIMDSLSGGGRGGSGGGSIVDRIADALNPQSAEQGPAPEETMSDQKALLLIRAMIAAANSDGQITPDERARIMSKVDEAGADPQERRLIEAELQSPKPLDSLLPEVNDRETGQQFYLASRAAVDATSPTQKSYLTYLRQRLNLAEDDIEAVEKMTA